MIDYGDIQERPLEPEDTGFIEFCTKCGEEFTTDYLADPLICDPCRRKLLRPLPISQETVDALDDSINRLERLSAELKKARLTRRQA